MFAMASKQLFLVFTVGMLLVVPSWTNELELDADFDQVEIRCRGKCYLALNGKLTIDTSDDEAPYYLITKAFHSTKMLSLEVHGSERGGGAFRISSTPRGIFTSHPDKWLCTKENVSDTWREEQDYKVSWVSPYECAIKVNEEDEDEYTYEDYSFIREQMDDSEFSIEVSPKKFKRSILKKQGESWLSLDCDNNITQYCICHGQKSWASYFRLEPNLKQTIILVLPIFVFFLFTSFLLMFMVETLGMKNNKKRYMIGRSQKVKDAGKNDLQHGHLTSFFGLNKKHNE